MSNESDFDATIEAQEEDLHRYNRAARRRNIIMAVVAFLAVIFGLLAAWLAFENDRLATANAEYGAEQAQEKQTIAKEAQKALCGTKDREIYDPELCAKWAEVAEEPALPPVEPQAVVGPSQEELVKAFREYCAEGNCRGRDGASPTADDIAAAFVRFCADGRCMGPAGKDAADGKPGVAGEPGKDGAAGANGVDGKDGLGLPPSGEMVLDAVTTYCSSTGACVGAAGKDGPPPTAEVVLAAVKQVCADNACQGPMGPVGATGATGEKGEPGVPGVPGRGIQSTVCGDDGRWVTTYTDGTVQDSGQCHATIIPPGQIPGANP